MIFGSVCSGIEAASVAWHPLGWRAAWLSEIESFPSKALAHHYPDVPNLGDMTKIARLILIGEIVAPDVLVGGTPCFTAGHMVLTSRGYMPIEAIVPGEMVVTHKGHLRPVVRIGHKSASVGQLSGVGIGEGIVCTADHPFRSVVWRNQSTKRGNQYTKVEHLGMPEWTPAKDMPGKQWCALVSASVASPKMPDGVDERELMYIAGFYLGDGFIRRWIGKSKKCVVFGVNPVKAKKFAARVTLPVSSTDERTTTRLTLSRTAIADWLVDQFGEYSHAKTLPAWVLSHPHRDALLDGYRDTDGQATANGWRAISVSRSLAYGMRDLSQTLGMVASVAFTKAAPTKVIEGRIVNQRDYWTVTAFNGETSRKSRVRHGMLLRTVTAFEETHDDKVFNIEVEGDHSYILDGAIVHNCQAFSIAGLREGLDDARGQLTLSYVRLLDAIDYIRGRADRRAAIGVWENVPGVLSDKSNAFGCLLAGLAGEDVELKPPGKKWANAGCVFGPARTVAWRTLDAQYFGLAQRRRRVFVVASARKGFDPCKVLFEFDGVRRDTPPSRDSGTSVAALTANGVGTCGADDNQGQAGHLIPIARSVALRGREGGGTAELGDDVAACLRASSGGGDKPHVLAFGGNNTSGPIDVATARNACASASGRMDFETETFLVHPVCVTGDITHTLKADGFDGREDGTGRGQPIVAFGSRQNPVSSEHVFGTLSSSSPQAQAVAFAENSRGEVRLEGGDGSRTGALSTGGGKPGQGTPMIAFQSSQSGVRLGDVHATLDANNGARRHNGVIEGLSVRRLMPIECERLQGFPDGYTAVPQGKKKAIAKDGPRYKSIGNSMAVPCMTWIGRRIAAQIGAPA